MNNCDLKIFTDDIEPVALNQLYTLIGGAPFDGKRVRIMPDVHAGTGCVVGFTAELGDKIIPNVLGVDLGCGMLVCELGKRDICLPELDNFIKTKIPSGSACAKTYGGEELIEKLVCFKELRNLDRLYTSCGTLGGGNHFIELDRAVGGEMMLVIHSGSRNLGLQVAKIYQKLAVDRCKNSAKADTAAAIERLKREQRQGDIPREIEKIAREHAALTKIPAELCYLAGDDMQNYLHDLKICRSFASLNRRRMAKEILAFLKIYRWSEFETVHNYLADDGILRKGSISAHAGERVIIPMNMRDGCLIAVGKGNADWNFSAPHGAGRALSRGVAKELISLDEYRESMSGVYSTTVCEGTLDESPFAYKPTDEIARLIEPTVEVVDTVKPVYNFKAGGE